tara:strand:- start:12 stop:458 length:447 start_codon:yes stop_codon:yes gene_type:complete
MKSLMEGWRKFLTEEVKYQGILKLKLQPNNTADILDMQSVLPDDAILLGEEDLHVTLIHQSILKPFRKQIKDMTFPPPPPIVLEDDIWERQSLDKKSWAVRLVNQEEMREYVKNIMEMLGSQNTNPEPERIFHISLANLTGNPHDSVR